MILAIDSGAKAGWAVFDTETRQLEACGLNLLPDVCLFADGENEILARDITRLVIERPHAGRTRARARDILTLAIRAGEAGGVWKYLTGINPEYIEPQRWKGQLPKARCNAIVAAKLSPQELLTLNKFPKSTRHNVLDAIGIGLFSVGR